MRKIYRAPKVKDGQIKMQRGRIDGDVDMCVFYGNDTPSHDISLVMNYLCSGRHSYDGEMMPSLIEELEARGYDLDTLKFSIERKTHD